ncbi:MAG TPA: PAS domain S-box protein, partial [Actinomycetota bacterium]|nr:PAS domain S-box protein [Actinomycetota bacterium]
RELEAQLAAIVASTDDAIYSKDSEAFITTWNHAAESLYGYTAEEAIGQPVRMLLPDERRGEEREILDKIMVGEQVDHYETRRITKDGRLIDVEITASPMHDANDQIVGASVIARDIADRKKADAMAQQLERQEFVNLVAHELRSPLAAITGASDLLSGTAETLSEQGQKLVDMIARQTRVAQRLINDLLDLSRIQSARFEVNLTELSLAAEVHDVLELLPAPEGKTVRVDVPEGLSVVADQDRLRQVMTNLIANAFKYGGGEVTLAGRKLDASVELIVADNGEGLSDEVADRAFEPFVRGRSVSRERGSGLGLSITKALMEAFDGRIRYERSPTGAAFVCTFHGSFQDR